LSYAAQAVKFNLKLFLTHVVGQASSRRGRDATPYVGVDEHINSSPVTQALTRLVAAGIASGSKPLWYQRMESPSGQNAYAPGRLSTRARERPEARPDDSNWSEESVLASLFIEFGVRDRLVLLIGDRGRDSAEMRNLLGRYVRPNMEAVAGAGLGLLVLGRNSATSQIIYAAAMEARLRTHGVEPGYAEAWF
jgi:hypothetical protein